MLEWLEDARNTGWLLVLDALDDMETTFPSEIAGGFRSPLKKSILDYIPKASSGTLLVTSRDRRIGHRLSGYDNTLRILEPTLPEALSLLRRKLLDKKIADSKLAELVTELGHLPLALTQAAAYINESKIGVDTYIHLVQAEARPAEILDHDYGDTRRSYGNDCNGSSVFRTFQISFDRLVAQNANAADLLAFLGVLEGCVVPRLLFSERDHANASHHAAITLLEALSLVELHRNREVFYVHKLVHLCARRWISLNGSFDRWQRHAALRLCKTFPRFDAFDWAEESMEHWDTAEALLPHALLILKNSVVTRESDELLKKLHILVVKYKGQCNWRQPFAREIEATHEYFRDNEGNHLKWYSRACDELVSLRAEQGRYQEGASLLENVIKVANSVSARQAELVDKARLVLASCKFHNGSFNEALSILAGISCTPYSARDQSFPIRKHRCDEIKAMVAAQTGYPDLAVPLFQNVVQWKLDNLGAKHLNTLASRKNLCISLVQSKRFLEAEALGTETLKLFDEVKGRSDPRTLWVRCLLAETNNFLGRPSEAENLAREILDVETGNENNTATSQSARFNLACALWLQGRLREACAVESEILTLADQVLTDSEANVIALLRLATFGRYLHRRGRGAKSRRILEAVARAQDGCGAEQNDIATTRRWLEDVENCTCHALDISFGCWQPPCRWRAHVVEGMPAYVENETGDDKRASSYKEHLWTQRRTSSSLAVCIDPYSRQNK